MYIDLFTYKMCDDCNAALHAYRHHADKVLKDRGHLASSAHRSYLKKLTQFTSLYAKLMAYCSIPTITHWVVSNNGTCTKLPFFRIAINEEEKRTHIHGAPELPRLKANEHPDMVAFCKQTPECSYLYAPTGHPVPLADDVIPQIVAR